MPFLESARQQLGNHVDTSHTTAVLIFHLRGEFLGTIANNPPYIAGDQPSALATLITAHLKRPARRHWRFFGYLEAVTDNSHEKIYVFLDSIQARADGVDVSDGEDSGDQLVVTVDNPDPNDPNGNDDVTIPVDVAPYPCT